MKDEFGIVVSLTPELLFVFLLTIVTGYLPGAEPVLNLLTPGYKAASIAPHRLIAQLPPAIVRR
jgi:hypothetical protein